MKKINTCSVCGITSKDKEVFFSKEFGDYLCNKHWNQMKRYGKFLDTNPRGVFDKNEIRIYEDYAEVDCYDANGNVDSTFIIDVDDVPFAREHKWQSIKKTNKFYITTNINRKPYYYHRMIIECEGKEVDHINGNSLDNRKQNLRLVNRQEQLHNLKPKINNRFGIRGISMDNKTQRYTVDFRFNKIRIYFKDFDTINEAVFVRYITEKILNERRYTENDSKIFEYISGLSENQKRILFDYTISKIKEKFNISEELDICKFV